MPSTSTRLALAMLCAFALSSPGLSAQDQGQPDLEKMKALVRQIHRNMKKVETKLAIVESKAATEAGQQAKRDMDELIDQLKGGGTQIIQDMDELIANWPQ